MASPPDLAQVEAASPRTLRTRAASRSPLSPHQFSYVGFGGPEAPAGPPRPARVVATGAQLTVLRRLYERYGEDATKAEVDEAAFETGLYVALQGVLLGLFSVD